MLSLVYSLLVSTRTPHRPHPNHPCACPRRTRLALAFRLILQPIPPAPWPTERKASQKEKPNGDVLLPKQFKECEARRLIGAESVSPGQSVCRCVCENISFRLSLRRAVPAPKRRLYALRLSGASTLLVPDARPKSAARLDRFPPPGWNRPATPPRPSR